MKKLTILFICNCGFWATAQNTASFSNRHPDAIGFTFGLKNYESLFHSLSVYSPTTGITGKYAAFNGGYSQTQTVQKPVMINGIAADSFNPNGAIDMRTAIAEWASSVLCPNGKLHKKQMGREPVGEEFSLARGGEDAVFDREQSVSDEPLALLQ